MHYVILTILALFLAYAALRAFLNANPKTLASTLRKIGGVGLLLLAVFFAATGRFAAAVPLAIFAFTLLGRGLVPGGFNPFPGNAQKSSDQKSRVRTGMVEMELDHDSGDMDGSVISGRFAGSRLSSLSEAELVQLLKECTRTDEQAAQLVEAYMDRRFPDWREGAGEGQRSGNRKRATSAAKMTVDEALEILGLGPDATKADIRKAHRTLMKKLHPDQGGSTYLAAKINEAKDLLLGAG